MQFNLLTLIGISLAAMFFGYFFGLFEGRAQGSKRRQQDAAAEKAAAPALSKAPPPAPTPREESLLRLSLDGDQKPVLEMDGRPMETSSLAPDQRKRLIDLMLVMRPWVEAAPATRVSAGPPPDRLTTAPVGAPSPVPTLQPTPAAARAVGAREAPEPGSPSTMVGQIDAILQMRLAGTPLASRAIHVAESSEGGAIIFVGAQRYAGVGDVPDPEVKAAIKAAIAEWEAKYTPS